MLIIIIGPDGSGKTTIANEIIDIMKKRDIKTHHLAMNFEILPKLRDLINPFRVNKIEVSHVEGEYYGGMKNKANSKIKGMILATWYTIDYFLGNIKLIKWNYNNEIVIFARYFYDYYFQRGHINTPKYYLRILEVFIPKPDFIFTIKRNAKDIFDLKPELSIEEIQRQQDIIDTLLLKKDNAYIIDGNKGIDDTLDQIMQILDGKNE
jgi:thymidylate kinase